MRAAARRVAGFFACLATIPPSPLLRFIVELLSGPLSSSAAHSGRTSQRTAKRPARLGWYRTPHRQGRLVAKVFCRRTARFTLRSLLAWNLARLARSGLPQRAPSKDRKSGVTGRACGSPYKKPIQGTTERTTRRRRDKQGVTERAGGEREACSAPTKDLRDEAPLPVRSAVTPESRGSFGGALRAARPERAAHSTRANCRGPEQKNPGRHRLPKNEEQRRRTENRGRGRGRRTGEGEGDG